MNNSAADLARAAKGAIRNGGGWLIPCPCPSHGRGRGDRNPSLSIADGRDGRLLVRCYAGCDPAQVLRELKGYGGARVADGRAIAAAEAAEAEKVAQRRESAAAIWRQSIPISGTEAERYLIQRGLTPPFPQSLRHHGSLRHPKSSNAAALVAAVQAPDGSIMAVHRTFLHAHADPKKMMLGTVMGGAVRLGIVSDTVLLAEGIETALSAMQITGAPAWACLSSAGMIAVQIPSRVTYVIIAADHDLAGLRAARKLRARIAEAGVQSMIMAPTERGMDWNDVIMARHG